jgi:hypothetical protein
LEQIGGSRWEIVAEPLGVAVDARLRSAGHDGCTPARIQADNAALGMWIRELHLVLINEKHEALIDTDQSTGSALDVGGLARVGPCAQHRKSVGA